MKTLGIIIHGPEVIDEGEAEKALKTLKEAGFGVEAALGGITGKTAVIDAGMRHVIDISKNMKPSEVMADFVKRKIDFIVLLNHAKTEDSGFMLGEGILRNFSDCSSAKVNLSFLQLEYSTKIKIRWLLKHGDENVYTRIASLFSDFEVREPYKLVSRCKKESDKVYRVILDVHPDEKIVVAGVVIGLSSHENENNSVTLVAKDGKIVDILGGTLIKHNLKKLPPLNLANVMVKTASVIRRTKPKMIGLNVVSKEEKKKACFACLFFSVENIFPMLVEDSNLEIAVTVGDDTTSIAGDILKRFGIRMIGITDGDADGLINGIESGALEEYRNFLPYDSVIIRLKPEKDDEIGEKIKEKIFNGTEELDLDCDNIELLFDDLMHRILDLAEEDIIGVLHSSRAKDD